MVFVITILAVVFLSFAAWLVMLKPGKRHELTPQIEKYLYAHRGLHNSGQGVPENSMASFRRATMRGYGIELDLHLSADGTAVVMHDTSLLRTAGKSVDITDVPDADMKNYPLEKTEERIPFFSEVLLEVGGRVPLLIELKVDRDNYAQLCDETVKALKGYAGVYAIQSFDPRAVRYLKNKYPHIMRGQLSGYLRKSGTELNPALDFGLRNLLSNFLTKPNFISYRVEDTKQISISLCRFLYKPLEFNWTLRNKKHHAIAKDNKALAIFEDYIP